jgi:esterase/lipase superfamily enzyme
MQIQEFKNFSIHLNQEIEMRIYGTEGIPVLAFPTRKGRYYDFENFGMLAAIEKWICAEKVILITVDSIDDQSWANQNIPPVQRAQRHEAYDHYIIEEVVPFVHKQFDTNRQFVVLGCDMGAYHAANFFFRYPDVFDSMLSMSGWFQLQTFVGDYIDETVYFHSPLLYLPNLTDDWYLEKYRQSKIVICVGQGAWEEACLANARAMQRVLQEKNIPALVDYWGLDVSHDWPWWRKQLPHFMDHLIAE